jgi:hypothetical protein
MKNITVENHATAIQHSWPSTIFPVITCNARLNLDYNMMPGLLFN